MKIDRSLYFIALVPEQSLSVKITKIKQFFAEQYNSKAALRSPPHLTLLMPFQWKTVKESTLHGGLEKLAAEFDPFQIILDGFGSFPPKAIYINPEHSTDLDLLKKSINNLALNEWKLTRVLDDRPFHPHVTVAFRDLRKALFNEAWSEFVDKPFNDIMEVRMLTLLKHNGKSWDIHAEFPLSNA